MPILLYRDHQIPYTLKSSRRRRTLALQVNGLQQVTVLAPARLSVPFLDRILQARAGWVLKKLQFFSEIAKQYPLKQYANAETFLIRGKPYGLAVHIDPAFRKSQVEWKGESLVVRAVSQEKIRPAVHL